MNGWKWFTPIIVIVLTFCVFLFIIGSNKEKQISIPEQTFVKQYQSNTKGFGSMGTVSVDNPYAFVTTEAWYKGSKIYSHSINNNQATCELLIFERSRADSEISIVRRVDSCLTKLNKKK